MQDLKPQEYIQHLRRRWKEAFDQYRQLKVQAEEAVVRWEWTDGQRYSLLPHYFERYHGRGSHLEGPPTSPGLYLHYGFDSDRRTRLYRTCLLADQSSAERVNRGSIGADEPEAPILEAFYWYADGLVEIIEYYGSPPFPVKLHQVFHHSDKVTHYANLELNGYNPQDGESHTHLDHIFEMVGGLGRYVGVEKYDYAGDLLTTISGYREVPGLSPYEFEEQFQYDAKASLERIVHARKDGFQYTVFQRPGKGEDFQAIRQSATTRLVRAIVDTVRSAKLDQQIYSIELPYQAHGTYFPPLVFPVPESYRQDLLNSDDPDARFYIFNPLPQAGARFLEITDPEALDACQLLEQEIHRNRDLDMGTRILRDVAAQLTRYDWTGILNVTHDFVVYAIDQEFEGHDIAGILASSASPDQIQEWKERGWLD